MHIELIKMSQFFARPIGNEDKKLVGLDEQVKTEIGLRIFEECGLAQLVEKRPFGPFWRPTKKLNRDLKRATLLLRKHNLKAAAALLSSLAVSKGKRPAQVTFSGWPRQHERYAQATQFKVPTLHDPFGRSRAHATKGSSAQNHGVEWQIRHAMTRGSARERGPALLLPLQCLPPWSVHVQSHGKIAKNIGPWPGSLVTDKRAALSFGKD
jgi:hypothetical protein